MQAGRLRTKLWIQFMPKAVKILPDEIRTKILFIRRKTWPRGLRGFTLERDKLRSGLSVREVSLSDSEVLFSTSTGDLSLPTDCLLFRRAALRRCLIAFWYVRLRSRLNVSWKKRMKERRLRPERIVRNQKIARQLLKPEVSTPPRMGPRA